MFQVDLVLAGDGIGATIGAAGGGSVIHEHYSVNIMNFQVGLLLAGGGTIGARGGGSV